MVVRGAHRPVGLALGAGVVQCGLGSLYAGSGRSDVGACLHPGRQVAVGSGGLRQGGPVGLAGFHAGAAASDLGQGQGGLLLVEQGRLRVGVGAFSLNAGARRILHRQVASLHAPLRQARQFGGAALHLRGLAHALLCRQQVVVRGQRHLQLAGPGHRPRRPGRHRRCAARPGCAAHACCRAPRSSRCRWICRCACASAGCRCRCRSAGRWTRSWRSARGRGAWSARLISARAAASDWRARATSLLSRAAARAWASVRGGGGGRRAWLGPSRPGARPWRRGRSTVVCSCRVYRRAGLTAA